MGSSENTEWQEQFTSQLADPNWREEMIYLTGVDFVSHNEGMELEYCAYVARILHLCRYHSDFGYILFLMKVLPTPLEKYGPLALREVQYQAREFANGKLKNTYKRIWEKFAKAECARVALEFLTYVEGAELAPSCKKSVTLFKQRYPDEKHPKPSTIEDTLTKNAGFSGDGLRLPFGVEALSDHTSICRDKVQEKNLKRGDIIKWQKQFLEMTESDERLFKDGFREELNSSFSSTTVAARDYYRNVWESTDLEPSRNRHK